MAVVAFSITKRVAFRDSVQEFSNVYHYNVSVTPNEPEATNRIVELETFEKTIHSTAVSFLRGRCWLAGGTPSQNRMISDVILTGTGSRTNFAHIDRERAFLVQWPAGFDSRNKQVYLRKWYHSCGNIAGVTLTDPIIANTSGLSAADQTAIETAVDAITSIGTANEYNLCGPTGRATTGPIEAHRYFEHHQLGDQWRQE